MISTKNYKSDFDAILHLVSCVGEEKTELGWPDYDWVAKFYTTSHDKVFIASKQGNVLTNCFNDNGQIHVVFNNHGLEAGTVKCEFDAEIPNDIYPDGFQREVSPQPLNIELVRGRGDCGTIADVEILLPYIIGPKGDKGDAFRFEDFTQEQIKELQKPAEDMIAQMEALEKRVEEAEKVRDETIKACTAKVDAMEARIEALEAKRVILLETSN